MRSLGPGAALLGCGESRLLRPRLGARLRGWEALLSDTRRWHTAAQRVHVPVGLGAEHGSTLLERRAARGQVVLLEPVGRSQTRLSYC